jgi:hypothetical protein
MGYCIEYVEGAFHMRAEDKPAAHAALVAMWADPDAIMGGGGMGRRWFAWLNDTDLSKGTSASFEDAMREWRYPVDTDEDGNVTGIGFVGEKIGDEGQMFAAIAPFVEADSYIDMSGEDGARWRWAFDGETVVEKAGKVSYD